MAAIEVRYNDDGTVDEIITRQPAYVHFEQMDDDEWWGQITVGQETVTIGIRSGRKSKHGNRCIELTAERS